ncbi:prolipoprotein diacylglyceryl transferase [Blastopirellula sp. JC732]|uniref:Phosphatidylglycerol--prolipoprotein diacylglyceryl transferase n=1 Tax=Blastopirellula sediminis TaxID=2894196 RepID=A0A9X1MN46_9BACT|nr:prolipoprotein diacylglyceryl transferase family protein [Blastopirellula sediminis]MCC9607442.1 prolipoprotein diacylglyceryl transferase [Blastopirellula sediminis]MCC9629265.1 prolipoprotein diacylglyceryl transferase [Blastopirellula sediminis]
MRQTLFLIPQEFFGLPLAGFGWLLILWTIISLVLLAVLIRRQGWNKETASYLPMIIIVAVVIAFGLPMFVAQHGGIPIRGYGVMLLAAVVAGVSFAAHRAQKMGLHPDAIYSLAFWMFIPGILGARVFFVIQYWNELFYVEGNWKATFFNAINFTEGGLVVYGSLIGAAIGFLAFCYRYKLPALALADLIAPSLFLGLCLGRIGCLLNGCCYGGVCEYPWAISFPEGSPPYQRQLENGEFFGVRLTQNNRGDIAIGKIRKDSAAAGTALSVGDVIVKINGVEPKAGKDKKGSEYTALDAANRLMLDSSREGLLRLQKSDDTLVRILMPNASKWSLPVHPTQIYASLNALILFFFAAYYYPTRKHDGEVIAISLGIYSITRYLLELIRTDELSFAGTGLTISQNVSIVIFALALVALLYIRRKPPHTVWPLQSSQPVSGDKVTAK